MGHGRDRCLFTQTTLTISADTREFAPPVRDISDNACSAQSARKGSLEPSFPEVALQQIHRAPDTIFSRLTCAEIRDTSFVLFNCAERSSQDFTLCAWTHQATLGIFKYVQVLPHIECWPFWGPLFSRCCYPITNFGHFWAPSSPLTFHKVKNHGGGSAEGEPGGIARNEEQKKTKKTTQRKTKTNRYETTKKDTGCGTNNIVRDFLVRTSPAEGWRRFHKNTAYARLGV